MKRPKYGWQVEVDAAAMTLEVAQEELELRRMGFGRSGVDLEGPDGVIARSQAILDEGRKRSLYPEKKSLRAFISRLFKI